MPDLSRVEQDEAVGSPEEHLPARSLIAGPHVVGPAKVRAVDLRLANHPAHIVVIIESAVGAEPDVFRNRVFQNAENRLSRQPLAGPVLEIRILPVAVQQVDSPAARPEPDFGTGRDAIRTKVVLRIGSVVEVIMRQNPPRSGIHDIRSVVRHQPQTALSVVEERFDVRPDLVSAVVRQVHGPDDAAPGISVHQRSIGIRQPDSRIALLQKIVNAQRLRRGRIIHAQVGKTPPPRVERLDAAVESRNQQPSVPVVAQPFDHVRRNAAAALLRIVDEAVVLPVPVVQTSALRTDPQVARVVLLETADDGMVQPARRGLEIVHAVVRQRHVGQFAPVGADPYPAVGIGKDRPHRIVGQRIGIMEVRTQEVRTAGRRVQEEKPRLRGHPDNARRIEKQLLGSGGFFVFDRQPEILRDTAVPVAFVQAIHERKDIDRPAALHDIADHAAVAAHGREKRVLSGLAVEPVEVSLRRGINVFAGAYQRQRRNRAVRRPLVTHHLGQTLRIERFDVVVADQPHRTVAVDHDRTDVSVQYGFETPGAVVEAQQSVVGSDVQTAAAVRDHLSVIPIGTRREARDQIVHPDERTAVIHEQRIVSAEPDPSYTVLGDAVNTSVIGGFGHGVEPVVIDVQRSTEGGGNRRYDHAEKRSQQPSGPCRETPHCKK